MIFPAVPGVSRKRGWQPLQIRAWIGATSVNYISIPGLIRGLALPENELCLACVTKRYPTAVGDAAERLALRSAERTACAEWPS